MLYALGGFLVAIVAFISVFQLDRIVRAPGKIVPIQGSLFVQPLDKAIIRSINVGVGDFVKKDQVLATLDPTFATADLTALQQKVASLEPEIRRIEAEDAGLPFIAKDPTPYEILQQTIWFQRQKEYNSSVEDYDEKVNTVKAKMIELNHELQDYNKQVDIASQIVDAWKILEKKGYVGEVKVLSYVNTLIETQRLRDQTVDDLASTRHELASAAAERAVYIQKWRDANLTQLVTEKNDLDSAEQDLAKALKTRSLINLVAPEDGTVIKVADLSAIGAVVEAGHPLFTLVPAKAPLEADIQIAAKDAGFPQIGDKVNLKFDAYKFLEHGTGEGRLKTISQDSFTTNPDGTPAATPYFDGRVEITAVHLRNVPSNFQLVPGMTLQADLVVGRRTILWYILGGALRNGAEAMHEP